MSSCFRGANGLPRAQSSGLPLVRMRLAVMALAVVAVVAAPALAQVVSGRAGWEAIREGRTEDATIAFAEAIRQQPRDASLYVGAALAAQLLGDMAHARESLEQALKLAPNLTIASLLLGDLLYRQSDLQGAIAIYEAARNYAPDDKTVSARLARLRDEPSPEEGFFQSQRAHFTVLSEAPADRAQARRAVDSLEDA